MGEACSKPSFSTACSSSFERPSSENSFDVMRNLAIQTAYHILYKTRDKSMKTHAMFFPFGPRPVYASDHEINRCVRVSSLIFHHVLHSGLERRHQSQLWHVGKG